MILFLCHFWTHQSSSQFHWVIQNLERALAGSLPLTVPAVPGTTKWKMGTTDRLHAGRTKDLLLISSAARWKVNSSEAFCKTAGLCLSKDIPLFCGFSSWGISVQLSIQLTWATLQIRLGHWCPISWCADLCGVAWRESGHEGLADGLKLSLLAGILWWKIAWPAWLAASSYRLDSDGTRTKNTTHTLDKNGSFKWSVGNWIPSHAIWLETMTWI